MATFTPERFAEAMAKAPEALYLHLRKELGAYIAWFTMNRMARAAKQHLRSRSGALSRSFKHWVVGGKLDDTKWLMYSDSPYAQLQEFGGTVRAKTKRYLSVPLPAAMTRAGKKRGSAPSYGYEKTFVAESGGKVYVFLKKGTGKRQTVVPIFRLQESVTVPPRLRFFETFQREQPRLFKAAAKAVDSALDGIA